MPGSSVHGVLQARILEYPPGGLPDPGIKPRPPALQADSLLGEPMILGCLNQQKSCSSMHLLNTPHKSFWGVLLVSCLTPD